MQYQFTVITSYFARLETLSYCYCKRRFAATFVYIIRLFTRIVHEMITTQLQTGHRRTRTHAVGIGAETGGSVSVYVGAERRNSSVLAMNTSGHVGGIFPHNHHIVNEQVLSF